MNSVKFCRTSRSKRYISDNSHHVKQLCYARYLYRLSHISLYIKMQYQNHFADARTCFLHVDLYIEPLSDIDLHGRSNLSYLSNKSRVQTFTLTHIQSLLKGFQKNMHVVLHLKGIIFALKQFNKYSKQILQFFSNDK